jgi:hypothetical protein
MSLVTATKVVFFFCIYSHEALWLVRGCAHVFRYDKNRFGNIQIYIAKIQIEKIGRYASPRSRASLTSCSAHKFILSNKQQRHHQQYEDPSLVHGGYTSFFRHLGLN